MALGIILPQAITDQAGNALPNTTVVVTQGGVPQPLFTGASGATPATPRTDAAGNFQQANGSAYYAVPGVYQGQIGTGPVFDLVALQVTPGAADVSADPAGTAAQAVASHSTANDPHGDRAWASGQFGAVGLTSPQIAGGSGTVGVSTEVVRVDTVFPAQPDMFPYSIAGTGSAITGTYRLYPEVSGNLTVCRASIVPTSGSATVITVKKNGSAVATITIPAGQNTATATPSPAAFVGGTDYFTVDAAASLAASTSCTVQLSAVRN
jgi:hypothetical protein